MVTKEWVISRPAHFPKNEKLDRLIAEHFDPSVGPFAVERYRRHARDLRRALFGPVGSRDVPDHKGGMLEWRLPQGWTLRLTYERCGDGFEDAGEALAQFIPPAAYALKEAA
jgi:hypothetical protein